MHGVMFRTPCCQVHCSCVGNQPLANGEGVLSFGGNLLGLGNQHLEHPLSMGILSMQMLSNEL